MTARISEPSQLIELARRNDRDAMGHLLESYRSYLGLLARVGIKRSLNNLVNPSDLVHDAMVKAIQHFKTFRGTTEAELAGWLRQILARCMIDLIRKGRDPGNGQVRRIQSLERMLDESSELLRDLLIAKTPSPSEVAEARDLGVVLSQAMAELPEKYREVLVLRNLEQLPWPEVARRMDRTEEAVSKLRTRALGQLAAKMRGWV